MPKFLYYYSLSNKQSQSEEEHAKLYLLTFENYSYVSEGFATLIQVVFLGERQQRESLYHRLLCPFMCAKRVVICSNDGGYPQ